MTSSSGALLKHWTSREEFLPLEQLDAHQRCSKTTLVSHRRRSVAVVVWYWIQVRSRRLTAWIWNCQTLIGRWRNPSAYIKTKKLFTAGAPWLAAFKSERSVFRWDDRFLLWSACHMVDWWKQVWLHKPHSHHSLERTLDGFVRENPWPKILSIEKEQRWPLLSRSLAYLFESLDEDWEHERRVSKAYSLRWYNESFDQRSATCIPRE